MIVFRYSCQTRTIALNFYRRKTLVISAIFFPMVKSMVKHHANQSFQILPEFFSGKSFMQWAPAFHKGL